MSTDAILEVEGLTAGYTEEPIIDDVAMRAERGRITGIIGPNGCGKSTFLKAIVGIVQPTRGHVQLDGVDITRFSPFQTLARGLAYIPQGRQVFPDMSVHENLLMSAYADRPEAHPDPLRRGVRPISAPLQAAPAARRHTFRQRAIDAQLRHGDGAAALLRTARRAVARPRPHHDRDDLRDHRRDE
jgi:ABC-type cobalamin/Fe3+-siderophores transport system ATPase subunit